jgi:hypothetical protein
LVGVEREQGAMFAITKKKSKKCISRFLERFEEQNGKFPISNKALVRKMQNLQFQKRVGRKMYNSQFQNEFGKQNSQFLKTFGEQKLQFQTAFDE